MSAKLSIPALGVAAWTAATLVFSVDPPSESRVAQPLISPPSAPVSASEIAAQTPSVPAHDSGAPSAASRVSNPADSARAAPTQSQERKEALALELREADTAMYTPGPADVCFDQMRAFMCPMAAQIPFVREMVAQMAVLGGFSCPTGTTQGS